MGSGLLPFLVSMRGMSKLVTDIFFEGAVELNVAAVCYE